MICCELCETLVEYVRERLLANCCSMVIWGPLLTGLVIGGESLRVDFNIAGAEQALEAAAGGVIEGLVQDEIAGLIGKDALAGLLLELRGFLIGAAQREKGDDVGLRQAEARTGS